MMPNKRIKSASDLTMPGCGFLSWAAYVIMCASFDGVSEIKWLKICVCAVFAFLLFVVDKDKSVADFIFLPINAIVIFVTAFGINSAVKKGATKGEDQVKVSLPQHLEPPLMPTLEAMKRHDPPWKDSQRPRYEAAVEPQPDFEATKPHHPSWIYLLDYWN